MVLTIIVMLLVIAIVLLAFAPGAKNWITLAAASALLVAILVALKVIPNG